MKLEKIHKWNLSYKEAVDLQNQLKASLIIKNAFPGEIKTVAGVDVSYSRETDMFFASIVCLDLQTLQIIDSSEAKGKVSFPYIPGLLSFREGPVILQAYKKLRLKPDVMIFDGHGISHPRGFGIASHIGVLLGIPTIGCAKSKLMGTYREPGLRKGAYSNLLNKEGIKIGAVLRTRSGVKPVFISTGHRVSLKEAKNIIMKCTGKHRLPIPTRQAHIMSNIARLKND